MFSGWLDRDGPEGGPRTERRGNGVGQEDRPTLSVVVPVHDVADYLPACLDSILGQSWADLEVVLVDDGSTDDTGAIARERAEEDPRLRVTARPNAGLGASRNLGVRLARGRYLAFADGDDLVPPGSYEALVPTLERTGSDFVVGTLERLGGRHRPMGRLMRENHARRREEVTLAEMPLMLADVFAVNKVFRRSFWDEAGLQFPTATRYEDQPTMTRAFLAADRFDVLARSVYQWRRRSDGSSITQTRHRRDDLRDRLATKRDATQAVLSAHPGLARLWFGRILPVDMWAYFTAAATADDDYWVEVRDATRELWNAATVPFEETEVPVQQRMMGWLTAQDRREDLRALVAGLEEARGRLDLRTTGQVVTAALPGVALTPEVPAAAYTLAEHELGWDARVLAAAWEPDRLRLEGYALVENVPTGGGSTSLEAHLCSGEDVVPLVPRPRREPRATRRVRHAGQDYDDCGFALEVPVAELARRHPLDGPPSRRWSICLRRSVDGLVREGPVNGYRADAVDRGRHEVDDTLRVRLVDVGGGLELETRRVQA